MHLLPPELRGLAEELCKAHAPLLRPEHFDEVGVSVCLFACVSVVLVYMCVVTGPWGAVAV